MLLYTWCILNCYNGLIKLSIYNAQNVPVIKFNQGGEIGTVDNLKLGNIIVLYIDTLLTLAV